MGREVRKVPADWRHPTDAQGHYIPLFDGATYAKRVSDWDMNAAKWAEGMRDDFNGGWQPLDEKERAMSYADWDGERPNPEHYMPQWSGEQATHLMMYEDTTEGTPISPAFATAEALARWLADNGASWFAGEGVSYDAWLSIIQNSSNSIPVFVANRPATH
ncbi:hypothetical protein [Burkholderia ubonensis]|uniref:hypothetical protein n=1 Tax=Burkholderia ubonensis TaxID=101571 RepID=UPI00075D1E67|nr:hypothetical protein [Burkholderia ubonensis]KVV07406.1 hypothetical protein WK77_16595 [Burkholderia ubonensis]